MTSCPWCGDSVYYHTNGYGDSVYFDDLGYPWQVHECFKKYWESKKALNNQWSNWGSHRSDYTDFFEMSADQQKRQILVGAAHQIPNVIFGQFLIYRATENALAHQMKISVDQLREIYGDLYVEETGGIKIFSQEELELKLRRQAMCQNSLISKTPLNKPSLKLKPQSKLKPNSIAKRKQVSSTRSNTNSHQIISCPHCRQGVRSDRLQKHISQRCKFTTDRLR